MIRGMLSRIDSVALRRGHRKSGSCFRISGWIWMIGVSTMLGLSPGAQGAMGPGGELAIGLYQSLSQREPRSNFVVSPYALRAALGMLALGARGRTQQQLQHLSDLRSAVIPSTSLVLANRLWLQGAYVLGEKYQSNVERDYGAAPWLMDFSAPTDFLGDRINGWTTEKTLGKVGASLVPGDLQTHFQMVLTSGFYFRGNWAQPFQESANRQTFNSTVLGDGPVLVPFIENQGPYATAHLPEFQVIDLPYTTSDLSMAIFLPPAGGHFEELEKHLGSGEIQRALKQLQVRTVAVSLPTFSMDYRAEFAADLARLGANDAFDPKLADFSGMLAPRGGEGASLGDPPPVPRRGLYVDRVAQSTSFVLTADGTELSGESTEEIAPRTLASTTQVESFRVDRPFVFMVYHRGNHSVLSWGRILRPDGGR